MANQTTVEVAGGALATVVAGPDEGEPVLLVAGGPGEARSWRYTFPELEGGPAGDHGLRIAAFDRRGVGGSSDLGPLRTAAEIGRDATSVGQALFGDRFHVVGISVGGFAALHAALDHPEHLASLTLVEVFLGHDVSDRLADLGVPTLVIGCEHDQIIPIADSELLATGIGTARLVRVPSGHAIDIEAPGHLVELIVDHVARHPSR